MKPVKDKQTVTSEGESIKPRIEGLVIHPLRPHEDERGELVEVFRPSWGLSPDPLVYVYQASVRPGKAKGWIVHEKQEDRIYICRGTLQWAFYDFRPDSPTYEMLNVFTFSERNRALLITPRGVFHAVKNVGQNEAVFINMPTRPYDHADPDKRRLPLHNDLIPYPFDESPGW